MTPVYVGDSAGGLREAPRRFETAVGGRASSAELACGKSGLSGCPCLSPHCRSSSLCPEAGTPAQCPGPPGGWFQPSQAPPPPPTTLISLLPFLLFGVDVLLRCRLDLLDPGRPGGEAECHRADFAHGSQVHQEPQSSVLANLGFEKFPIIDFTVIQLEDLFAN